MPTQHIVQPGECASSIACVHGHFPASVWEHPDNAALNHERGDPYVLCAGDTLVIPDLEQRWESVDTDKRHTFRRKGVPEKLNVQLVDEDDTPLSHRRYTLEVEGRTRSGETDSQGIVDEWISPTATSAVLTFALASGESEPLVWEFSLGALDPADTDEGLTQRLHNLGFDLEDEEDADAFVREIQRSRGLPASGVVDEGLLLSLEREHGA